MAKVQTFGDKMKKKKKSAELINVKVIKGFRHDDGNTKFLEKFVKVKELSEIDNIDISK